MKIRRTFIYIVLLGVTLCALSCVQDLDFGQLEEIRLTPVVEADFIFSTFDMEDNIPEELPPNTEFEVSEPLRDTINYDFVGTDFAIDNLDRVELTIEIKNQIERGFLLQFQFLNGNDESIGQLYTIPIAAGNGEDSEPVTSFSVPNPIILDKALLKELQNTQKIYTELFIPTLNSDLKGELTLRSKAVYFVNYAI